MTNSMSNTEFVTNLVESKFKVLSTEVLDKYQVSFEVKKEDVHSLLSLLKTSGWIQLSYLSAVDWPNDNEFELVYIVFNWDKAVHIQIRCRLDRETASMNSILPIFPGCKYYEREAHEFFGIKLILVLILIENLVKWNIKMTSLIKMVKLVNKMHVLRDTMILIS